MTKNNKIISAIFLSAFVFVFFVFTDYADAAACQSRNLFPGTQEDIGWGDTSADARWSPVTATPNSQVRLSIAGEDGCARTQTTFQILNSSGGVIKTFSGTLTLGKQIVGGSTPKFQLYYDWTNDLSLGTGYKFRTVLPIQAGPSSNVLNIERISQACRLSTVNTTPPGGTDFGVPIRINVTGQGTCRDWGVTVNIYETTGGRSIFIATLSEQKFTDNNQLAFSWTPVRNPGAGLQAAYRADAVAGSQTLSSNPFTVSGSGTGRGSCNSDGNCDPNESAVWCPSDCRGRTGTTTTVPFSLDNPLGAENIIELIDVLATWLFTIAIPIAVVMIVWAGVMFLTSQGEPAKVTKARQILLYAVVGLAIIMIGKGFITLIESILNLGAGS